MAGIIAGTIAGCSWDISCSGNVVDAASLVDVIEGGVAMCQPGITGLMGYQSL